MKQRRESGFTMIELMIAMFLFSIVSVAFISVLLMVSRAATESEEVVRVSEEARLGLNRLVRDAREGQLVDVDGSTAYVIENDFDGDGVISVAPSANADGDYEQLKISFDTANGAILLNEEILADGVEPIAGVPMFSFTSNDLQYDWNGDGVTTTQELDQAPGKGYSEITGDDIELYDNVEFAFLVRVDDKLTEFRSQAQLRNRR